MSYKYLVKNFTWVNGKIRTNITEFAHEADALTYAKYSKLAETTKVYEEDSLIYEQRVDPTTVSSYA